MFQIDVTHCRAYDDDNSEEVFLQPTEGDYLEYIELFQILPDEMELDCLSAEALIAEMLIEGLI